MARTVGERPMRTKSERARLEDGTHWRDLNGDLHLGYKKSGPAGKWLLRSYDKENRRYVQKIIGFADDVLPADATSVFSYAQAEAGARSAQAELAQARARAGRDDVTVTSAVRAYIEARETKNKHGRDARSRLTKHVLNDEIAGVALDDLSSRDLIRWDERARKIAGLSTASLDRLKNDFRAALNQAIGKDPERFAGKAEIVRLSMAAGRHVSTEPTVLAVPREYILGAQELHDLLQIAKRVDEEDEHEGDVHLLTLLLAATGARFSQLARVCVGDLQPENSRVMLPTSFKGRAGRKTLAIPYPLSPDVCAELQGCARGRRDDEPLLLRWRRKQVAGARWVKDSRGAWREPDEYGRIWREEMMPLFGRPDLTPYALRHTRIVDCLRDRLPLRVVAAMHDTSTEKIEQSYSAYIVSALEAMTAAAAFKVAR